MKEAIKSKKNANKKILKVYKRETTDAPRVFLSVLFLPVQIKQIKEKTKKKIIPKINKILIAVSRKGILFFYFHRDLAKRFLPLTRFLD